MAAAKGRKKSAPANKKEKAGDSKPQGLAAQLHDEIIILLVLAISILLLLSLIGFGAKLGNAIASVLFGMCGLTAYMIPFLIFFGTAFIISNRTNTIAKVKVAAAAALLLFLCAVSQLLAGGVIEGWSIFKYYTSSVSTHMGGGFIGALICLLMCPMLGTLCTYILLVILSIISCVIITEKSFLAGIKKGSKKVIDTAKADARKRKDQSALRQEQRERSAKENINSNNINSNKLNGNKKEEKGILNRGRLRAEKKARGVISNVEIKGEPPLENIHEITGEYAQEPLVDVFTGEIINPFSEEKQNMETEQKMVEEVHIPEPEIKNTKKEENKAEEVQINTENISENAEYKFPPISLLNKDKKKRVGNSDKELRETAVKLQQTLENFGVNVTVTNVSCGPAVTRYELQPEQGVKVSRIVSLSDDIKLNLAASDIRIEAPIPGKPAVGIEVPNKENSPVMFRDLIDTDIFRSSKSKLTFAVGKDISGQVVVTDIAKMPHLLIAGATGSGKSVCINTLIMSILYKAKPSEVKLIMIDPKVVELSVYNGIPHLYIPVVTDPKKAAGALNWAVAEMTERYNKFAKLSARDIKSYNEKVEAEETEDPQFVKMPHIVIIVDELADLMMVAPGEVEDAICRLAQLARAAGIHLVIATQRPSVNVITGLIKANVPSRIAFSVSSGVDSRTIIDMNGAEKLLGKGDMLFYPQGYQKPARVQGSFVSDEEVMRVVSFLAEQDHEESYNTEVENKINEVTISDSRGDNDERDTHFAEAGKFIIEKERASIGMIQRMYKVGFNRASRIMDQLAEAGVVGPEEGTKPRKVLMTMEEFEHLINQS